MHLWKIASGPFYDANTSIMEQAKLLRSDYLDILFEGRNKAYGGYELRRRYAARTRKASAYLLTGVLLAASVPIIASSFSRSEPVPMPVTVVTTFHSVDQIDPPKPLPFHEIEPPAPVATIHNPELKITADEKVTEQPPSMEQVHDKQPALTTITGDPGSIAPQLIASSGGGHSLVENPGTGNDAPATYVDQLPEFEGDLETFLRNHLKYPDDARLTGIEGRVGIKFVVDRDGSITDAEVYHKASPLLDAEALRVVRSMPKWRPGKLNGRAVKAYFTLPITFSLD